MFFINVSHAVIFSVVYFNHSLIKNSEHLVEIDINGNAIGENCAVKILEALKDRKKGGAFPVDMTCIYHRPSFTHFHSETFI